MIEDFDELVATQRLECDICIVGSGPVGLAVALELAGSDQRVIVLETGGDRHEPEAERLSEFESVGHRRVAPSAVRRRIFGGTSSVWSGRCVPFSALDLQRRDWLEHSGWPLRSEEIQSHLQRAGGMLQVGPAVYDDRVWSLLGEQPPASPWDPARFETQVFQASVVRHLRTREIPPPVDTSAGSFGALNHSGAPQAEDIAEMSRQALTASRNIRVLLHAHAVEILTDESGARATGVRVRSLKGAAGTVHAREVVLACGGIDNARLLLLSRSRHAAGIGNAHDLVGRYLLDHHYAAVASIAGNQAHRLRRRMGYRWLDRNGTRHVYLTGVSLSPQCQREEHLPRATLFLFDHFGRPAAIGAARRVAEGVLGRGPRATAAEWGAALLHPLELAQGVFDRYVARRPALSPIQRLDIGCNVEQVPNASSRVSLGEREDALGQPVARIDWRIDEREFAAYRRTGQLFIAECQRLGLEVPQLAEWCQSADGDWRAPLHDMAHPMGTTRMADDPRHGVVDRHCAVHGVAGLHVVGSSVFPTGGTSNPTLMAVALALRLADRLKATAAVPRITTGAEARVRVGVVGAGARVRDIHAPVLAAMRDAVEVCGFTSRSEESRGRLAALTGWSARQSLPDLIAQRPDFLVVAVGGEANAEVLGQAIALGIPVLGETPLAWQEKAGRRLVAEARGRGVPLGIAEQFPFLPVEQLKRKLIGLGAIGAVTAAVNDFATYDYHGIAQLRAYAGYERVPLGATARRFGFGRTGARDGHPPATPELGWPEDWQLGIVEMSGGVLLLQNFSAGYAVLPTRPPGELRVLGQGGSIIGDRLVYVDRASGARTEQRLEHDSRSASVSHPALGRIEWHSPLPDSVLSAEQLAVALHVESLRAVVREGGTPLYSGEQALGDIEILRGLHYSAEGGGRKVSFPLRSDVERVRAGLRKAGRRIRRRR